MVDVLDCLQIIWILFLLLKKFQLPTDDLVMRYTGADDVVGGAGEA